MANIFCEAAAEWDHDWDANDVCRECGLGGPQCELNYSGCTGLGELREDPYEADVNENPGVYMIACNECAQERSDGI